MLLLTPRTYRARAFLDAAERLGIEVVKAVDMHHQLADYWNYPLGLEYDNPQKATQAIVAFAAETPIGAILAVDDSGSLLAAEASRALGLPHNSPEAALAARSKHQMRQLLRRAGVSSPEFHLFHFQEQMDVTELEEIAVQISYPCVVKPLNLSGSRGVIRADDRQEFVAVAARLRRFLFSRDPSPAPKPFLVERFIPGFEVALEGILDNGRLQTLALFDKPDPLDGPFFEETIYVTPSRLPAETQAAISDCAAQAAAALGLREGPIHAELRVNEDGPWIVEVAGRSIGGLCSQTLRFGTDTSLEELILRQAFGLNIASLNREDQAGGVMMIPIPEAGLLRKVEGVEAATAVSLIESVEITARVNYSLTPLPEGDSYLGFIFARGQSPAEVEAALREAHSKLHFEITPEISLTAR